MQRRWYAAPRPNRHAHVPYNIVRVDGAESFRMMAHGENDLAIGDAVVERFAGLIVPYFMNRGRG